MSWKCDQPLSDMIRIRNDDEVRTFPSLQMPPSTLMIASIFPNQEKPDSKNSNLSIGENKVTTRARNKRTASLETRNFLTSIKLDCSSPVLSKTTIPSIITAQKSKIIPVVDIGKICDGIAVIQPRFDEGGGYSETRYPKKHGSFHFMIYRHITLSSTEEFKKFRTSHVAKWAAISGIIRELEDYLRAQGVMLAVIDGDRVQEISKSYSLTGAFQEDLISCIISIRSELPVPFLDKGGQLRPLSEDCAASVIQRVTRRNMNLRRCSNEILQNKMAILIQSLVRRLLAGHRVNIMMNEAKKNIEDRWTSNVEKLKSSWRRTKLSDFAPSSSHPHDSDNEMTLQGSKTNGQLLHNPARLLICIPSTSSTERTRLLTDRHQAIQNMHIACMYQLADPHVHILYISPINLSQDEVTRYEMLATMEWDHEFTGDNVRFHIIVPELLDKLPAHLSVSQVLWCSFLGLKKIKMYVSQFTDAVIVPCSFSWVEKRLSHHLNIPLLGPDPTVACTITSRSFVKQIFTNAGADTAIGARDIYTSANFLVSLSTLIVSNMETKKWIFRLHDDLNNEHTAYLSVTKLSITASLRAEMIAMQKSANGLSGSWHCKEIQLEARKRMLRCLRDEISTKAVICRRDYYRSWEQYEKAFRAAGMVIEAEPVDVTGSILGLAFIDPYGSVQIIGGVDCLMDQHYQVQGYIGPMTLADDKAIHSTMKAVSKILYDEHNVIGYVSVEFRASRNPSELLPRFTALGIRLGLSPAFLGIAAAAVAGTERSLYTLPRSLVTSTDGDKCLMKAFVYLPYAHHAALSVCRDDAFARICKSNGIIFDQKIKIGTVFFRLDTMGGDSIGTLSVAVTRAKAIATAIHSLQCILVNFKSMGREKKSQLSWDSVTSILSNLTTLSSRYDRIKITR